MSSFQTFVATAVPIATLLGLIGLSSDFAKRISAIERKNEHIADMLIALLEANQIDPVTLRRHESNTPLTDWNDD